MVHENGLAGNDPDQITNSLVILSAAKNLARPFTALGVTARLKARESE
jgi:hypothetical protein